MLDMFVHDFAAGMKSVDAMRLSARGRNRTYQPGVGPYREVDAVAQTVAEMKRQSSSKYGSIQTQVRYPKSSQKCDVYWEEQDETWAIEVKMIRFRGDNGKLADLSVQDILSPYSEDHSALSDCIKLARSGFVDEQASSYTLSRIGRGPWTSLSTLLRSWRLTTFVWERET